MNSDYSISVRSITKVFAGVKALDNVSIDVVSGKVHGLIGANGAGKSTLIKILAGVYHPDEGQILIDGNEVKITDPATSTALGLSFIHQDLHLVEHFNVMQNMLMGEKKDTKLGLIDWKKSIGTVFSYECFSNFRLGVGADVAWYVNRLGASTYNSKKNAIDIPIVARVSYTLKWLELQLSYKQGTCNLMNTSGVGKVTSRNIQFSVFMPIFK